MTASQALGLASSLLDSLGISGIIVAGLVTAMVIKMAVSLVGRS